MPARALALLYAGSGLTGLAYEVLWARLFSIRFGVSIFGVTITVSALLAGLAIGSLAAQRWLQRRPATAAAALRAYGALEAGVALYALALPWLAALAGEGIDRLASALPLPGWYGLQALAALALLTLPGLAMGAAFPCVLAAAGDRPGRLGRLYGVNTLGAAAGALLPLATLPQLGWTLSLRWIAAAGFVIGLAALGLAGRRAPAGSPAARGGQAPAGTAPGAAILALYAGVGAASLMLEIGWTRVFGMVLLRTEYVLALILAVYLLGTAAGSLLQPLLARGGERLARALPLLAGAGVLASLAALPTLSAAFEAARFSSLGQALLAVGAALAVLTLPVTLVLGCWLPAWAAPAGGSARAGALLYGVNCLGAAGGALLACTVGLPWLGSTGTVALAAVALCVLGLAARLGWRALLALPVALACAWPLRHLPAPAELLPQALAGAVTLQHDEDALGITDVVETPGGQRLLLTDLQRMDASSDPAAVQIQADQARLALLLHPAPRRVLFLGLGTGISAGGALPFAVPERTAVELSAGAIDAAGRWFGPVNGDVLATMTVRRDDARHFLAAGRLDYDVIVGDLFHPDLAGASSLLSVEQFARARARLAPGGVFVQWLALNQFDRDGLDAVLRAFARVYADGRLYMDGMHLALVGSREGAADAPAMAAALARLPPTAAAAATGGEGEATWLGRSWGRIDVLLAGREGPLQSESRPYLEYRLPRLRYGDAATVPVLLGSLLGQRPTAHDVARALGLADGADATGAARSAAFARAYEATTLMTRSWIASLTGDAEQATRLAQAAWQANPDDRWAAGALADALYASLAGAEAHGWTRAQALDRILQVWPEHLDALRQRWQLARAAGDAALAQALRHRLLAVAPLDREPASAGPVPVEPGRH